MKTICILAFFIVIFWKSVVAQHVPENAGQGSGLNEYQEDSHGEYVESDGLHENVGFHSHSGGVESGLKGLQENRMDSQGEDVQSGGFQTAGANLFEELQPKRKSKLELKLIGEDLANFVHQEIFLGKEIKNLEPMNKFCAQAGSKLFGTEELCIIWVQYGLRANSQDNFSAVEHALLDTIDYLQTLLQTGIPDPTQEQTEYQQG